MSSYNLRMRKLAWNRDTASLILVAVLWQNVDTTQADTGLQGCLSLYRITFRDYNRFFNLYTSANLKSIG